MSDAEEQKVCDDCLKKPCYSACVLILGLRLHKAKETIERLQGFIALAGKTMKEMESEHTEMRLKIQEAHKILDEVKHKTVTQIDEDGCSYVHPVGLTVIEKRLCEVLK